MAAAEHSSQRNSNTQLLEELEALSQSLYQTHSTTNRRTASLALPRTSVPTLASVDETTTAKVNDNSTSRPRFRRMSLSPWRSRPKPDDNGAKPSDQPGAKKLDETATSTEKKGLWNWKPIRALSHIGMQKLTCLFSVEVVAIQGLPASMNGLRLSVCIRKTETKDGAVHTMPSRVSQGAADFEETLFVKCHVYCTSGNGKELKFEPRPFWIYAFAVDAGELDFGRGSVDLSRLIQESMEKNQEGTRIRQWDTSFNLSGKAKGGELVLKLGFQIMEKDGGIDIYSQDDKLKPTDLQGIDDLNLDEPAPVPSSSPSVQKSQVPEPKIEELELPEFDVVDKGVEIQEKEESEENVEAKSASSEVVKEMVHDQVHLTRLNELDSIAQQIKALESMMGEEKIVKIEDESESQGLDADEETVTREFFQMLEDEGINTYKFNQPKTPPLPLGETDDSTDSESKVYLSDLGKGLGCAVQTRNGGYLAAMNPLILLLQGKTLQN
ncbi:hypothetical protein GH714_017235 [Hevea brasiliensis]|uniref:C2 NT-type domain-containing protein n=1 Tax=Hevea brasiliensis TaxID=3981 RepID=A0A6A6NIZ1_HEVBR|nr:hypothetical protein GH714_017235 [Hevea brasiliensis]